MANPIPYNQLFDIDGLKTAIKETQAATDEFGAVATEDFKRIQGAAASLRKELEGINAAMNGKTIKLTDESGQAAVKEYAKQVSELTNQIKTQQAALDAMNAVLASNKIAISDAKVAAANYAAEQQNLKAQQEATKLSIQDQNLFLVKQKQAILDAKLATEQQTTAQAQNKTAISASNLANQQYITTVKQNQASQSALNVQIAQTRLQTAQLTLANKQAAQSMTAATGSYKEAQQQLTALGNSIKNAAGGFTNTTPAIKEQIRQYNELNDKLKAFDAQMGNHQRKVGDYSGALAGFAQGLKGYIENLVSFSAAVQAIHKVFDTSLEVDATRTSLGYLLGSFELADEKMRMLKETSNRLGLEFVDTAKAYAMFTGAAKASNFDLNQSDKIFQSVSRVLGVLHTPAEGATRAFYALQEMISMGTVQSRQLNRMLGLVIPGSTKIMADALGVTVEKLHDMEKAGELLTSDVLPKFADQLDKAIAPGVTKIESLQASFNNLKNTFSEAVDDQSNITKFFSTILDGINLIARDIAGLVNSSSWKEFWTRALGNGKANYQDIGDQIHDLQKSYDNTNGAVRNDQIGFRPNSGKDRLSDTQAAKNVTDLKIALDEARKAYEKFKTLQSSGDIKQGDLGPFSFGSIIDMLKSQINLYEHEYPAAIVKTEKATAELTDAQLTSIKQIRDRITELSKLPGSAIDGSDINNRIDALKKRLHDLTAATKAVKDGFALVEQQIRKTSTALEEAIIQDYAKHQGKESEATKKLADEYQKLTMRLIALKKAKDEALLNVARQQQIQQFGSVFPTQSPSSDQPSAKTTAQLTRSTLLANTNQNAIDATNGLDDVALKYAKSNREIAESYKRRNITKLEYDAQLLESERHQSDEEYFLNSVRLANELQFAKLTYGETSKQYKSLLLQKAKLDEQYSKQSIQNLISSEEKKRQIIAETVAILEKSAQTISSLTGNAGLGRLLSSVGSDLANGIGKGEEIQKSADLAMGAISTYTDFAINASKQRQSAIEAEMQYEINGAGTNAEAKKKIEEEYNKKIIAEKRKQAKLAKAAAAVDVILNTAVAVSKVFGQTGIFGIALAPVVAALGAVELGIVLAQPLPQFEKGRENGPATFAEVNEKGPEALVDTRGRIRFANKGKRGVTFLRKDEKVIPADETTQMLNRQIAYSNDSADKVSQSKLLYDTRLMLENTNSFDYDKMGHAVGAAVAQLPIEQNVWNEKGYSRYQMNKASRIKAVRDRNKL